MEKIKNIHKKNDFSNLVTFLEKQKNIENMSLFENQDKNLKLKDNVIIENGENFIEDKDNNFDFYSFYLNLKKMFRYNKNGFIIVMKKNIKYSIRIGERRWDIIR